MTTYTYHTPEGIKQTDHMLDAFLDSHHTTSSKLISVCGVVGGMGMSFQPLREMLEVAKCPSPDTCADNMLDKERKLREEFNSTLV